MRYGDKIIMSIIKQNNTWLTCKKCSTHCETGIGFLKYVRTIATLQTSVKKVKSAIMKVELLHKEISAGNIRNKDIIGQQNNDEDNDTPNKVNVTDTIRNKNIVLSFHQDNEV